MLHSKLGQIGKVDVLLDFKTSAQEKAGFGGQRDPVALGRSFESSLDLPISSYINPVF